MFRCEQHRTSGHLKKVLKKFLVDFHVKTLKDIFWHCRISELYAGCLGVSNIELLNVQKKIFRSLFLMCAGVRPWESIFLHLVFIISIETNLEAKSIVKHPNFQNWDEMPHCKMDVAFTLRTDLMRPYHQSNRAALSQDQLVLNFRFSRARKECLWDVCPRVEDLRQAPVTIWQKYRHYLHVSLRNFLIENTHMRTIENQSKPGTLLGERWSHEPIHIM